MFDIAQDTMQCLGGLAACLVAIHAYGQCSDRLRDLLVRVAKPEIAQMLREMLELLTEGDLRGQLLPKGLRNEAGQVAPMLLLGSSPRLGSLKLAPVSSLESGVRHWDML